VSLASIQPGFRAAEAHVERASRVCARAFHDSPLWQYYIPQDRKRREKLHHIFAVLIRYGIRYGEVYATSPELEGIAVWVPSSRYPMSTLAQIRCGGLGVIPAVGFRSTLRLVRVNAFLESTHENVASGPHWYLAPIAVEPRHQGRGYAGLLLQPMLDRLDRESLPCYLETHDVDNVSLYQHYGFQVEREVVVPRANIRVWNMWRNPAKTGE
jgi:ribosomal protein S18 acetylase RimI-like enzyme